MKNKILYLLRSKIRLKITGKNINRFITRLNSNGIEILRCNYISRDVIDIIIYLSDYEKLLKLKTIYDVFMVNIYGGIKIKKRLNINKYLIISLILGYVFLIFLSNIIFEVEIVHSDSEIRELISTELKGYGLKKRTLKKSFKKIEQVKEQILNKYKNKIEWLEIEVKGTKYIVRVEERKINDVKDDVKKKDVVAKKAAIIKEIKAESGNVIREINNYVKPGDVIITGNIYLNDELKNVVSASGTVFGEVWYETSVTYPYAYREVRETDNWKNVFVLKLLNKKIEFSFKLFKHKKIDEEFIVKGNIFPIGLVKQRQTELIVIDDILTEEQTLNKALELGISKIKAGLGDGEHIIDYKVLNTNIRDNELELRIFFSVYENITDYREITELSLEN